MINFMEILPGDLISRDMGGIVMKLVVTSIDEHFIYCGPKEMGWKFSRKTGGEVDEDLGWGATATGSRIVDFVKRQ